MKIIGLTGPTGSGKSTVAKQAAQLGFAVIDCDKEAKIVVENDKTVLEGLCAVFGSDILNKSGKLDRKALAAKAFANKSTTAQLNKITLPAIVKHISGKVADLKQNGENYVLLDAPTLYESGADSICDAVIAVLADEKIRKQRVILRDKLTEEQANARLSASKPDCFYKEKTKHIIYNTDDISAFLYDAELLLKTLVM